MSDTASHIAAPGFKTDDEALHGPFPVSAAEETAKDPAPGSIILPRRNYECHNYETCLDIAAALNWDSFVCRRCPKCVNQKLLWRARQEIRHDSVAAKICELPVAPVLQSTEHKRTATPAVKVAG